MMDELQKILGKVAPWLVAAAGGPAGLATKALSTLAEKLGASEATVGAITQAVAGATPEQMLSLKQADNEFKVRMQELGFKRETDLEAIAAGDRANARAMQMTTHSNIPAILTCFLGVAFVGTLLALFKYPIPPENRDVVVYMCGQLAAGFSAALAFWLGTTRESANKNVLLANSQPVK